MLTFGYKTNRKGGNENDTTDRKVEAGKSKWTKHEI